MTLSQPESGVVIAKDVMVPMRDGVRLATDIYRPARDGEALSRKFPTILLRTIYDKGSERFTAPASYFCRRGYVAVVQDCRGRYASEGRYYHMANEAEDGYDAAEWIAARSWSDGKIGTHGGSYGSLVQSAMATQDPPALTAMVPEFGPSNIYSYGLRHDGAFQLKFLAAGFWLGVESREARADPAIRAALENANLTDWLRVMPIKRGRSPLSLVPDYERFVIDFMTRGDYGDFWANPSFNIEANFDQHSDVPMYFVAGWYDSWSRAVCGQFVELSKRKKGPIKLLMGHWIHGGQSQTHAGDVDFGPESMIDGNLADSHEAWMLRWFDRWLKGEENGAEDEPPVKLFVMGGGTGRRNADGRLDHGGRWRDEQEWPLARTQYTSYFLHPDGGLSTEPPIDKEAASRLTFDPNDPVPTISGNSSGMEDILPQPEGYTRKIPAMLRRRPLILQGGAHQAARPGIFGCKPPYLPLSSRPDVLVFQTRPLAEDVEVTGPITVKLWASSSTTDTDFTAKLLYIYPPSADYPDGYHLNVCEGIIRARYRDFSGVAKLLEPGRVYEYTIILEPTSTLFKAGHCIRLDISNSNFPRFDVNPNTGEPLGQHTHTVAAHNVVYHDRHHPSLLVLPVIPS